ncbi:hypothetical protein LWI29_020572 [Acer saccharum]|uniref:Uncharacterized protein n=1 Tax=Acer saccharum TaxID=4024 RepID=A0AA39VS70_ACESA|nr:hypothetical protein LWI29_020572 [Acer saccharum]
MSSMFYGITFHDGSWNVMSCCGRRIMECEHVFLDCSTPRLISNHIVSSGTKKSYIVRAMLPSILPPSYKGTTIRYLYYIKSTLSARWLILDNGHTHWKSIKDPTEVVCH